MAYSQLRLKNQICFRMYAVSRLIIQAYRPYLSKLGITYSQYLVLMVLWENDAQPVNDIAKKLFLETNTVTPLIQRMEKMGLLTRTRGRRDERQRIVSLTPAGIEMQERAKDVPNCMVDTLRNHRLSDATWQGLIPVLDEMIAKLNPNHS